MRITIDNMKQLILHSLVIFTQVFRSYGSSLAINVTVTEYELCLQWPSGNINATYEINCVAAASKFGNVRQVSHASSNNMTEIFSCVMELYPGELYNVSVNTAGNMVYSDSIATKPLPVNSIHIQNSTKSTVYLTWLPNSKSLQDTFKIFVVAINNTTNYALEYANTTNLSYLLTGLMHSSFYNVTLVTYSHGVQSNETTVQINTAPLPAASVNVTAIDTRILNISWTTELNSAQDSFEIEYWYNATTNNMIENVTCDTVAEQFCVLTMPIDGQPGQVYEVRVFSKLGTAVSEPAITRHSTIPLPVSDILEVSSNETSMRIMWTLLDHLDYSNMHFVFTFMSKFESLDWDVPGYRHELELTDIHPGSMFNVTIVVSTGYEFSIPVQKSFYTYPEQVNNLTCHMTRNRSAFFTLYWMISPNATFDNFIINVTPGPDNTTFPLKLPPDIFNYTVVGVSAGIAYTMSISTRLSAKESQPINITIITYPNKPTDINITSVSGSEVTVQWKIPHGGVDSYRLSLTSANVTKLITVTNTSMFTLRNFNPGSWYALKIESEFGGLLSEAVETSFYTNPSSVSNLQVTIVDSHTVQTTWEAPNNTNFDYYLIRTLTEELGSVYEKQVMAINKTLITVKIENLMSGQLYIISIATVTNATNTSVFSEAVSTRLITSPLSVVNLQAVAYMTGLKVTWQTQNDSKQSAFMVTYGIQSSDVMKELPAVVAIDGHSTYYKEILNLVPGGRYAVSVQALQNLFGESASSLLQTTVGITKPLPIEKLVAQQNIDPSSFSLNWVSVAKDVLYKYLIRHRASLRNRNASWVENTTSSYSFTLTSLFPGEKYEIEVYAVSETVKSDVTIVYVIVKPLAPNSVNVLQERTTTSSVTLQWLYNSNATFVEQWVVCYYDYNNNKFNVTVPCPVNNSTIQALIPQLVSGFKYNMSVQAVVQSVVSEFTWVPAITRPVNDLSLTFEPSPTNTSFIITYDIPYLSFFDTITFNLSNSKTISMKAKSDLVKQVEFIGLTAGTLYTVFVQTTVGDLMSDFKMVHAQTMPNPPLVATTTTSTQISLRAEQPSGGVDRYESQCITTSGMSVLNKTVSYPGDISIINNLKPYSSYRCDVTAVFMAYHTSTSIQLHTLQDAPSAVRNLMAVESAPTEVTLTWNMPTDLNGVITSYIIDFTGTLADNKVEGNLTVVPSINKQVFTDLKAGYFYIFHVRAQTVMAGDSTTATIQLKTYKPIYKEGMDDTKAKPTVADASLAPYTVTVKFANAFSDKYGEIIQYTIILTEDKASKDITNNHFLPGWKAARQNPAIKAYQVISNCSNLFATISNCDGQQLTVQSTKRAAGNVDYKEFVIGLETGCENKVYCNGPLRPDSTYYVSLRAYTMMQYSDTPFSDPLKTARIPSKNESVNVGVIVGSIFAVAFALVIVIVVAIIILRSRQKKSNMYRHQVGEHLAARSSLTTRKSSFPVLISDFKQHVMGMKADSDFKYAEQFEDLKDIGRGQSCIAAELPCNRGKNRFTNILPYDHSRVKLLPIDDEDGSDYINANYIPGYNSKREYIVTQGPLPATRDDFWRMLWEQNSRNIVMLTKCIEKGREKCDRYWPTGSDAVFYGDLQVAALNETLFPDWTITEFRVSLGDQSRQIRHFHFLSWPDFGVPKKVQLLVRFVRMVREKLIKDVGPVIVHCSAGVGRSGTFIVLDKLLQQIKSQDSVDIFNSVKELRQERVWMVQTEQQYSCIHDCLLCVVEGKEDEHTYDHVGHSNSAFEDDEGVEMNL